jgi:hypothetical protein
MDRRLIFPKIIGADELVHRLCHEPAEIVAVAERIEHQQVVAVVLVYLRPLVVAGGVFDRQRVEAELLAQQRRVALLRVLNVEPDELAGLADQLADVDRVDGMDEAAVGAAHRQMARVGRHGRCGERRQ